MPKNSGFGFYCFDNGHYLVLGYLKHRESERESVIKITFSRWWLLQSFESRTCSGKKCMHRLCSFKIVQKSYTRIHGVKSIEYMPIYPKRRLWRHMSESRKTNFARAVRFWQSVCFFVTRLLMFTQETS